MSLQEWSMHYRQIIILLVSCFVAMGIYGLAHINKNEFPDFTIRQGLVIAVYPGVTVQDMEEQVTKPLEKYIFTYKEVKKEKTVSFTKDGIAIIRVELNDELTDKDAFWSKFKHGVQGFKHSLPEGVLAIQVNDDFGDTSALLLSMESEDKTYRELNDYMNQLIDSLRMIPSVGKMSVFGLQKDQISIYINSDKLSHYGISYLLIAHQLKAKGFVTTAGRLKNDGNESPIYVDHALNKISRFRPAEGEIPKINKLGSKTWQTLKNSAKSRIKDIAKDLIQLYAKRKASKGYAFSPDTYLQEELESSFMYEDTPDQESATRAVKHDMEEPSPMDRLVCGDVGFGKTEIAIRAAFKAVADGKQVVVLVPTTILALQHFNTFSSRLKDFPCSVDYVSRLRTAKEVAAIKEKLKDGTLDIVIGTHKMLGKSFEFKDLGLLVIDEEQKFGVAAKEKLRQIKSSVDTLTLTATPIPRTLQFSLLGARDLSIINTPPPNRIPTQTEIILFDKNEIKSIIDYELNRGGQVFFLHNKVEELPAIHDILHRLVPDMKICVAHGRMESKELENKMLDFMRGDYDLLLCTTIIENGLDIPNANTIIINQAQNIGLSDLHQLRGRVGRSNRKAFCYLIVPPLVSITEEARRRLKAIEEFSDLGSGFNIAMQDLDIRGAGNLLGAEQSGFIMDMGYETYQKILSEAMEELGVETGVSTGRGEETFVEDCTIETDQIAMMPDSYIDITAEKIRIYKSLDSIRNDKDTDRMKSQIEDRFGPMPPEAENLFDVVRIRNAGQRLGFEKIIIKNGMLIMSFISNQMSPYFKSGTFSRIISRINDNASLFTLKQSSGKLKIVSRGVESLSGALSVIRRLQ